MKRVGQMNSPWSYYEVLYAGKSAGGKIIRRRRACRHCGNRVKTRERLVGIARKSYESTPADKL